MRTRAILFGLLLVTVQSAASLRAADFYVDVRHPKASDKNPGTRELPWKTIQHAADSVDPGATVHVMPGVYPESVVIGPTVNRIIARPAKERVDPCIAEKGVVI